MLIYPQSILFFLSVDNHIDISHGNQHTDSMASDISHSSQYNDHMYVYRTLTEVFSYPDWGFTVLFPQL